MKSVLGTTFVVLFLGTAAIASEKTAAQPPARPAPPAPNERMRVEGPPETNAELLQEVRRLREAIEMMVFTGARVQIVFGRLQLQEQRTATAARRLDELRDTLARATRAASETTTHAQDLEERLRDFRGNPEERAQVEAEIQQMKRESTALETERQRVQNEESMAAGVLASEQSRWAELNQQLEDLERALAKRP